MGNKTLILLALLTLLLSGCNIPEKYVPPQETAPAFIWDLGIWDPGIPENSVSFEEAVPTATVNAVHPTSTPQLIQSIDFEKAFAESVPAAPGGQVYQAAEPAASSSGSSGTAAAQWLFFDPVEYSSAPLETLYAAFQNSGETIWDEDTYLEFFAGKNPSKEDRISLNTAVSPGERGMFEIPITLADASWKACWHLNTGAGENFYEFCYNHADGTNSGSSSAQNQGSSAAAVDSGINNAFRYIKGTAPAKYSSEELSAAFVSMDPTDKHTFCAYDHYETFTAVFKNTGTQTWDSSYRLVFYNGYNWMHTDSVSLTGTAAQGEIASFSMNMEIFEDNDKWVTCWYLASPEGYNLGDFCFNYYTRSCN